MKTQRGFTVIEVVIGLVLLAAIIGLAVYMLDRDSSDQQTANEMAPPPQAGPPEHGIYPEVWTKNGYDGPSYEFKVNCVDGSQGLDACFLSDLTRVAVTNPAGEVFELDKDFNINSYSGEVTRRWVLYGEADLGFPEEGSYTFSYYRGEELVFSQDVVFEPSILDYPTDIAWIQQGDDLIVSWTPPAGMTEGMSYKVIVFLDSGEVFSKLIEWDQSEAVLEDLPLVPGEVVTMNVSSYFPGGYAYPESLTINWQ